MRSLLVGCLAGLPFAFAFAAPRPRPAPSPSWR
jgi:hypothetical protein